MVSAALAAAAARRNAKENARVRLVGRTWNLTLLALWAFLKKAAGRRQKTGSRGAAEGGEA